MRANDKKSTYLLDFYPSTEVDFHCRLTDSLSGENQINHTGKQISSRRPAPDTRQIAQCPQPTTQCPAPS